MNKNYFTDYFMRANYYPFYSCYLFETSFFNRVANLFKDEIKKTIKHSELDIADINMHFIYHNVALKEASDHFFIENAKMPKKIDLSKPNALQKFRKTFCPKIIGDNDITFETLCKLFPKKSNAEKQDICSSLKTHH